MATSGSNNTRNSQTNQRAQGGATSDSNNEKDRETLDVVKRLKEELQYADAKKQPKNQAFIELVTAKISNPKCIHSYDLNELRQKLSYDIRDVSNALLQRSMAYGDTPNQVTAVLTAMKTKEEVEDKSNRTSTRPENSLESVFEPLKWLKKKLDLNTGPSLFQAILQVDEKEIDRADRMLFSQAHCLSRTPKSYTMDNAHDHVQAIRLMRFESGTVSDLNTLIASHKTFDGAYAHLQKLAKEKPDRIQSASRSSHASQASVVPRHHESLISPLSHQTDQSLRGGSAHDGRGGMSTRLVNRSVDNRYANNQDIQNPDNGSSPGYLGPSSNV